MQREREGEGGGGEKREKDRREGRVERQKRALIFPAMTDSPALPAQGFDAFWVMK